MAPSVLFLMRHGASAPPGVLAGRADYPLTSLGREEILAWRPFFAAYPLTAVWASPLLRARQTAALLNAQGGSSVGEISAMAELSLGLWEKRTKEHIRQYWPEIWEARGRWPETVPPPQGESFADLHRRVIPAFYALIPKAREHPFSLLIAHQAVIRLLQTHLTGQPVNRVFLIPCLPGSLCALALDKHPPRLLAANVLPHNAPSVFSLLIQ